MALRKFLAIGECMIEMAQQASGLWKLGVAGDTLNTAWYFRRSTSPDDWSVDYFTRLGTDRYSDRIAGFLDAAGIGTSWIARDPVRQPGLYTIELESGERSFTYWRSQSAARLLADDEQLLGDVIAAADTIYFSGITLAILAPDRRDALLRLVGEARRAGRTTVFDPNIRPRLWESAAEMRQRIMQAAAVSSVALPSFEDERALFGDATPRDCARRYVEAGCGEVAVKNAGAEMCVAMEGAVTEIEGMERVEPVDTTGAGDSFNGAYLARRAAGDAPRAAAISAHALASEVVGHHGALVETASTGRR
jgi:2-dehydro-3-deoxygluconokinase